MPFATHDGARIYWKSEGLASKPALVLLNSIGTEMGSWDRTIPYLIDHFHVIRMDTRGHGASDAPDADYSLDLLARDVLAVMDAAGADRATIAGVSLGGMVAMELALLAPERVAGLGLICTTATLYTQMWTDRVITVRANGTQAIVDAAMPRFLSAEFMEAQPAQTATIRSAFLATPAVGYAGAGAAIRDMAVMERLEGIQAPTLVVIGSRDISTPLAGNGEHLIAKIPGAKTVAIDAPHVAPVEAPRELAEVLVSAFA